MSGELVVRASRPEDTVDAVIAASFTDGGDADGRDAVEGDRVARLWAELEQSDAVRASLVAVQDGEVVGHVGLSHAWLDARRELVDVWLLSPLSVVPARQGLGIGTRLLVAAVEEARSSDAPLLFVEGSPDFYGSRGFERASAYGFAPASTRTPDAAFHVVRFTGHEDWMTGQVIYRDIWWRHDAAGLRDPRLAELEEALR